MYNYLYFYVYVHVYIYARGVAMYARLHATMPVQDLFSSHLFRHYGGGIQT
jgi:hypothetical protein